jgi:signal transduction histidine kinase
MNTELFALLAQVRQFACLITDDCLRVVQVYDPGCLLAGDTSPLVGQMLAELAPELVGSEDMLREILAGRQDQIDIDLVNREDPSSATRYFRLVVKPLRADGSGAPGLICLVEDISEFGAAQQRLMQSRNELLLLEHDLESKNYALDAANSELRRLAQLKTSFVSTAAHELKTPLAIIQGYADTLLEGALGDLADPQREALATLRQSTDRLLGIVNNLLDLARLEAGRMELVMNTLDLGAIVKAAARELRPLFVAAQQQLHVSLGPDLPAVLCDEARAFQILANLLSNASKYTPRGGVIRVCAAVADDPGELVVSVQDNGVGIPLAEQPQLGRLFFRSSTANQVSARGIGMGLHITQSLVQLHGGRFWFESVEGHGSTFNVTFLVASPTEL